MASDTKFRMNDEVVVVKGFYRGMKFKVTGYSNSGYWGEYTGRYWDENEIELANPTKPTVYIKGDKRPWYRRWF